MNILLTNDDGYGAIGLESLAEALSGVGYAVYIAAPFGERSASSHAITVHSSMRIEWHSPCRIAIDGFPADCVNVALTERFFPEIDMVISGINHGPNMGTDVIYSGTVGGARQGRIHGLRSLAVSLGSYHKEKAYFRHAAQWVVRIVGKLATMEKPFLYNVNIPAVNPNEENFDILQEIRGIQFTQLGKREYLDRYIALQNKILNFGTELCPSSLKQSEYNQKVVPTEVRIDGKVTHKDIQGNTDFLAVDNGWISMTPLSIEQTDYLHLKELQALSFSF